MFVFQKYLNLKYLKFAKEKEDEKLKINHSLSSPYDFSKKGEDISIVFPPFFSLPLLDTIQTYPWNKFELRSINTFSLLEKL